MIKRLYYRAFNEDEDARVCTDIPESACTSVPANFARLTGSATASSWADELTSVKTVLPWLLSGMGAATFWTGLLVPIRESMALLPQLFVAAAIRRRPVRKGAWALSGVVQAAALAGIGVAALFARGSWSGGLVVALLFVFSLARGFASVSSKDVTGKTIPKTRRGRLTGLKTTLAGVLTVGTGLVLTALVGEKAPPETIAALVFGAVGLWLVAASMIARIEETPGATQGGKNAFREALRSLSILNTDRAFRRFVITRALFISTALAGPYYVLLAREHGSQGALIGFFVVASGLASAVSSLAWGAFADRSSKAVLIVAAGLASALGVAAFVFSSVGAFASLPWLAPALFFVLAIAHAGVRVGRKTYVLDLAGGEKRADYVAVGNTVIGVLLLAASGIGALVGIIGPHGILLVLAGLGFLGVFVGLALPQVE